MEEWIIGKTMHRRGRCKKKELHEEKSSDVEEKKLLKFDKQKNVVKNVSKWNFQNVVSTTC